MKILFINSEYNGVAYWRMWEPARFLNKRNDIQVTYWTQEKDMLKKSSEWEALARSHDVIVCARVSNPDSLAIMLVIREISQKPIVMEMDDNWWNVDPNSPAFFHWSPGGEAYATAHAQCDKADFFQLSTYPLKQQMCSIFGGWDKSFIAPNLIDFDKWQEAKKKYSMTTPKGKIRIGWGGSATHYSDFKHILPALVNIMNKYPQVELMIRGLRADFLTQKDQVLEYDQFQKRKVIREKSPLPLDRVIYLNGCHFDLWPDAIARMGMDIAIVPLIDSKFNKAKSNCRYLELSSLGVPGVYADVYPYSKTINNGVDGLVPRGNDVKRWEECISELIEDETKRKNMGEAAKQKVWEQYSLQNNINTWAEMYHKMNDQMKSSSFRSYYKEESWTQSQDSQQTNL